MIQKIALLLFMMSSLLQGGFSDAFWLLSGIIIWFCCLFTVKKLPPLWLILCSAALLLSYIASAVLSGGYLESWIAAGKVLTAIGTLLLFLNLPWDSQKAAFLSGCIVVSLSLIAYCLPLPIEGMLVAGRLQGSFQYANTFGVFLAVCAFLHTKQRDRAWFVILLESALLLTQSIGAIFVYLFCSVWAGLRDKKTDGDNGLPYFCLHFFLSALLAACMYFFAVRLHLYVLPLLFPLLVLLLRKHIPVWIDKICTKKAILYAGWVLLPTAFLAVFALRSAAPLATYLERLIQFYDGLRLMLKNPLTGIGPGHWAYVFPSVQSSFYNAAILHNGYIQAGVDGGIIAFTSVIFHVIIWIAKQNWRRESFAVLMICLHAAQDTSFSFFALVMLLCMLAAQTIPMPDKELPRKPYLFLLPALLCLCLFTCRLTLVRAVYLSQQGKGVQTLSLLENSPFPAGMEGGFLQMRITAALGDDEGFLRALETVPMDYAAKQYIKAEYDLRKEDYHAAACSALRAVELSPYMQKGYDLLSDALAPLDDEAAALYAEELQRLQLSASDNENPLYAYIKYLKEG